jgi:hypothetical protein
MSEYCMFLAASMTYLEEASGEGDYFQDSASGGGAGRSGPSSLTVSRVGSRPAVWSRPGVGCTRSPGGASLLWARGASWP